MSYKISYYNHIIPYQDDFILFNARTLGIAKISPDIAKYFNNKQHTHLDQDSLEQLAAGGFLLEPQFDEKKSISNRLWQSRKDKEYCSLTLAPTLGCNFNCFYCFESEEIRSKYDIMNEDTQAQIYTFLETHFQKHGTKHLDLCWFGGEPLLAINAIESMSKKLLQLADHFNIKLGCNDIITNGYKLDAKMAKRLYDCQIRSAQVTIDGPDYIHDSRRILKGGKGSFAKIIKNIKAASQYMTIMIRVNIDKQNREHLQNFVEQLELNHFDQNPNVSIYLAPVNQDPSIKLEHQAGISPSEFAKTDQTFANLTQKSKLKTTRPLNVITNACGSDQEYSYMIGPQGELYHCWEDFGNPKLAVGNVKTGRSENLEYIQQYYDFDPTTHPKCSTCTVMPLCMGGCPKRRLLHNEPHCGVYKFNLDQHVIKTFQALPPLDNNQITDTAQMKELATIPLLQAQFHEPYPNHHVFVLIPKTQELKKHLDPIKSQTQSFNKAQLHFLKTCKILLGNTITPDLYHWAKAMKDNNHLGSVPYAIQITHYLEKTVLTTSMHQYLLEKQPHILDDFIHAAKDQLDLIRINAYYPLEIIPTLLQSLNQVLAKHAMWSIFIKRIEIANESVQPTIAPLHHLPKIIIYLNIAHAQHADFVDFIQSLKTIFLSFKGAEPNLNHSFKWLESVTITQGCQRYKPYLQALGLLDSVYSQETHYAFRKERDYTLLDNCFF